MIKQKYFTGGNLFVALSIGFILWVIIAAVLDDRVKRSELPDDSIILLLGAYRFKVPFNYLYAMLLENEVAKMKYGIKERKYKKVKEVDYFSISVAYPDMKPMTIAEDKPGMGNKIRIYLSNDGRTIPLRKSAAARVVKESSSTNPGIVPQGFGSNEVLNMKMITTMAGNQL